MIRFGVDTGGTFTDFVALDDNGVLRVHKVLSTPHAPEQAILRGIAEMGIDRDDLRLVHGSTVATNAVLEGKGVRTVYVANRGFADLLTIGRQQRAQLYELQPQPVPPPVAAELCVETGGRLGADGGVVEPLGDDDLRALRAEIERLAPEAVAVNLLFSYLDPTLERRIAEALPDHLFVSLSSQVLPEIREYERGMATWLNAWVGPKVEGYLRRLGRGLSDVPVSVMQSSGDTLSADQAAGQAVRMLLSGPAGGLIAARNIGEQSGRGRLLTFDMGGTSTDVALIDGEPQLTGEGRVGRYPVAVPMVDMHTIGAGGGSIAWLDAGGMLRVGPRSAGAAPGPACYDRGGRDATVTDANLLLGRLQPDAFLGGDMQLNVDAARDALSGLAMAVGCSPIDMARDIVAVANENMAQALRAMSIKRGADPRDHVLMSFGGAGGMHVCALAELLDMSDALVPVHGGVLSALGMLVARPGRQLSSTRIAILDELDEHGLDDDFAALTERGLAELQAEGHERAACEVSRSVDLRYLGQSYTLNLPWRDVGTTIAAFHASHKERYGHALDMRVELVNVRVHARAPAARINLPCLPDCEPGRADDAVRLAGIDAPVPRFRRTELAVGQVVDGPAVISEQVSTTWLAPAWRLRVDDVGNLLLRRH